MAVSAHISAEIQDALSPKQVYCRLEFRTGNEPESSDVYGAMFFFQNQYLEPNSQYFFYLNIDSQLLKKNPFAPGEISNELLLGYVLNQFSGEGSVYDISVHQMPKQE